MNKVTLLKGDCLQKLKELKDNSVDSVVTDPPYHLTSIVKRFGKEDSAKAQYGTDGAFQRASKGFMGKEWDGGDIAFRPDVWEECYRVLKPGGHLLAFSHSRTYHRMGVAVEDAGFEIRDQIMWIYGSGFPKSHNIGKSVDKLLGNEREVIGTKGLNSFKGTTMRNHYGDYNKSFDEVNKLDRGFTPYEGWGTALKPAHEPIVMARKPFKGTVAQNVLEWGTGGININESRIGYNDNDDPRIGKGYEWESKAEPFGEAKTTEKKEGWNTQGRFPANIIFDEEAGKILDEQSGTTKSSKRGAHNNKKTEHTNTYTPPEAIYGDHNTYGDTGGASRFFYCPKAQKKDRNEGIEHLPIKRPDTRTDKGMGSFTEKGVQPQHNSHPTVKPTDLMTYLVRLVTPKGGTVLDPFMGSGSTGKASVREGMNFIGIEREDEYMEIAKSRIQHEEGKHNYRKFFNI